MNKRLLLFIGLGFVLAGCSLTPKYTQPEAPIAGQWPQAVAPQQTASTAALAAAQISWQDFFTNPQLHQLISITLDNNRDLRLAALNVARSRAMYGIQRAQIFPAVGVDAAASKYQLSQDFLASGEPRTIEEYGVDFGISSWEIDFFGRIRGLEKQAIENYLASAEAQRSAQIALIAETVTRYLTLGADRENLHLAQATLDTQQQAYDLIDKSYAFGVANELDLRRAQIPLETAKAAVARYTQMVAQDINALTLLAGAAIPEQLLTPKLGSISSHREIYAELPSEALLLRPDILAAEHQLKATYAFIGAARAAFFPRITLTTAFGSASTELSGLFGANTGTWNFSPQLSLPIFDARTWAAYRVSQAERDIAQAQYEKAIQVAFREVADTLAVQSSIDDQLRAQRSLVDALARSLSLADARYQNGLDNYLGVLDAQRSLFSAQQTLTQLRLAKLSNEVQLYAVLGGGAVDNRNDI
ncbi:MAG: efflux transporter outer membrane subunit [Desulfuromonas sp.]|nr:efflux transporter outer membrane subunit [Desulfuromonas sp.]